MSSKTPLYSDLFPTKYDEDDFGYSPEWTNEIEKWLITAKNTDEEIYNKQINRVNRAKQRDELLGEYKAMYVVKERWKLSDLKFTDEENAPQKIPDFVFIDAKGKHWNSEVKSPSWLAELAEDMESGQITKSEFLARKKKPQFINGEGRWSSFEIFRNPIEDAVLKFKTGENNLLFLCPNTFGPLGLFGAMEDWHQLRKIIAELDKEEKISAICYLDVSLYMDGFRYLDQLIKMKHLPSING